MEKIPNILYVDITIFEDKPIIYFLRDGDKIVYIGETNRGIERIFDHKKNKKFNKVGYILASEDNIKRKITEAKLIKKYNPKYNKAEPTILYKIEGYIRENKVRNKLKELNRNDITGKLRTIIKKNCRYIINGKGLYVKLEDITNYLKNNYGIILNLKLK